MSQSRENLLTDGRTDERTDGQTLFHRTLSAEAGGPIISFDDQNFGFHNFSYFSSYEIVVSNMVRQQLKKTCCLQVLSYTSPLLC